MTNGEKESLDEIYQAKYKGYKKGKRFLIRHITKKKITSLPSRYKGFINYHKILYKRVPHMTGSRRHTRMGTFIFDFVMLKIMEDMVDNKNTFELPYGGIELFVGQKPTKNGWSGIFALDTMGCKYHMIRKCYGKGFKFNIHVRREIRDRIEDKIYINKQTYIECKQSTGKQSLALYKERCRRSLTFKRKKSE